MFGIDDAIAAGLKVLDKFVPDPAAKAQAEKELRDSLQGWDKQQNDVNQAEAGNASMFVAGWRPFIGWVCGSALAYQYVIVPLAMWATMWAGYPLPKPPTLDDTLWQLMFGMLGMGGLRTLEKMKGIAR
jgi:hypothetical protein